MFNKTLLFVSTLLLSGCSCSSNVRTYDDALNEAIENTDFHSQLYIFPESTNKGTPTNFSYKSM